MATPARPRKKNSKAGPWMMVLLLVVASVLVLGTLHYTGFYRLPFLASTQAQAKDDLRGKVAVPISVRPISIFRAVKRDDLFNPKTKQIATVWIKEDEAKAKGFLTSVQAVTGRVMRFNKDPGYAFKETDFYPPDSPESPSLGVDKDMVGMYLDPESVDGIATLGPGERFQVIATLPNSSGGSAQRPDFASPSVAKAEAEKNAWKARQQEIVHDGKVILAGSRNKNATRDEKRMYIQLKPEEHSVLNQAMSNRAQLSCMNLAPQGAAPDLGATDIAQDKTNVIEVLSGNNSRKVIVEPTNPIPKQDGAPKAPESQTPPR